MTGVDLADAGVAQARRRAAELHLHLDAVVDDLDHYDLGGNQWDLIAMFYVHAWYHGAKPANIARIERALRPGGLLVIEGFAGRENMFQPNELLSDFSVGCAWCGMKMSKVRAEWAPGERSHVIRMVAEKFK